MTGSMTERPRNVPKVLEDLEGPGVGGLGAWEQQWGLRAPGSSFCSWERDPTLPSPSRQGRGVPAQCHLCKKHLLLQIHNFVSHTGQMCGDIGLISQALRLVMLLVYGLPYGAAV